MRYPYIKQACKQAPLGVNDMTKVMSKINRIQLPPHQLRALGMDKDWNKNVSEEFVTKALKAKEAYKEVFKELAKY